MSDTLVGNYLRAHRKKSALSQKDVASLLGSEVQWNVARHELSRALPPLIVALSYEAIFNVPVSEIFAGAFDSVASAVEGNIAEFEKNLEARCTKGRSSRVTAEKLQWLKERRCKAQR